MRDIAHSFDNQAMRGDLVFEGQLLRDEEGLTTAVLHSLFSDARADDDDLPDGQDRRGWWGDCLLPEDDRYGSKLWLLQREKQTRETLHRAREYAQQALAWLVEDGHAESVEVEAEWTREGALALRIVLALPNGSIERVALNYPWRS
jgi:phage gp46-like protein